MVRPGATHSRYRPSTKSVPHMTPPAQISQTLTVMSFCDLSILGWLESTLARRIEYNDDARVKQTVSIR